MVPTGMLNSEMSFGFGCEINEVIAYSDLLREQDS